MATSAPHSNFAELTEAEAEYGCVTAPGDVILSQAIRWFEDGLHVIRSLEYDLLAEDPDPERVVDVFVENALDLASALSELQAGGEATEDERETLALLTQRLVESAMAVDRERHRRRIQIRLRRRGPHSGQWRRRTRPASSTKPSLA